SAGGRELRGLKIRATFLLLLGGVLLPSPRAAETPKANPPAPNYAGQIAATIEPSRHVVYKTVDGRDLQLDLFFPPEAKSAAPRAAFVIIHGGGWTSGNPRAMYPFADWAAKLGLVGISVQYRLFKPGTSTTVFECVKDARSAVRYVRRHAAELGIDPDR